MVRVVLGVIFFAHGSQKVLGWELTPGKGHGYEANLAFLAMAVACLIAGGGALSLDLLIVP